MKMSKIKVIGTGKEQTTIDLGVNIGDVAMRPKTYACAIRVLLQNWRQGTVGCKARSEVSFSNKKPWRQKGTGRARAGSARSPLWRSGGVTFGPQPRKRELGINRRQKKLCFRALYKSMIDNDAIYCLDYDCSEKAAPKTKDVVKLLKNVGVEGKKKCVLLLPYDDVFNYAAFRNIPGMKVIAFDQVNAFDLSGANCWMFLKKDLENFKHMVSRWT
jgi:large subunit ribosomal protein L4